jgi:hypothetical protein
MRVEINLEGPKLKFPKKILLILPVLVLAGAGGFIILHRQSSNPLPSNIKKQITYKALYPAQTSKIKPTTYQYISDQKTLSFTINNKGDDIVFTEQPAPDSLATNGQVYYPALGLHPYAQFQSKLGPVALAKFYKSGNLSPVGESGILATHGTLLIAHSEKLLTNAEWKDLFDSLQITP